jgi:hypothetical protein
MTNDRPVSQHHVLAVTPRLAALPSHLAKTLMCLAAHANHKTGMSRPAEKVMKDWGIPYSTWHRHCVELTTLGLIRQVVRGNSVRHLAAEYEMLFVAPLTGGLPTTTKGKGDNTTTQNKSTPKGGPLTSEWTPWVELTPFESGLWADFTVDLRSRLDLPDLQKLNAQIHDLQQRIPLQRTVVRLVQHGHRRALLNALTERGNPNLPVYSGAHNVPAALFNRLRKFAEQNHVSIWDGAAVEAEETSADQQAWEALGARLRGTDDPPQVTET